MKLKKIKYATKDWRLHQAWFLKVFGHYFRLTVKIPGYSIGLAGMLLLIRSLLKQGVSLFGLAFLIAGFILIIVDMIS